MYRSVDHAWLRTLCEEIQKPKMRQKWRPYAPAGGFGSIGDFAASALELQDLRYEADYDPLFSIEVQEAKLKLDLARAAVDIFQQSTDTQRKAFLFLLLFKPRG